jgi:hypothetical protein
MAPPQRLWFCFPRCGKCGTLNRPGATACFLCARRFDTSALDTTGDASQSPTSLTSAASSAAVSPALSCRISSLLLVIAVVAICLAIVREDLLVGTVLALTVLPALAYTIIAAARREARGSPMAVHEKLRAFLAAIVGVALVAFSTVAMFFLTCVSVSRAADNAGEVGFIITVVIAAFAGAAAGASVTYVLVFMKNQQTPKAAN